MTVPVLLTLPQMRHFGNPFTSLAETPPPSWYPREPASIRQADLILVLDDGQLAGKGTHQELISTCETYREIFFSQFPEERTKYEKTTGKEVMA